MLLRLVLLLLGLITNGLSIVINTGNEPLIIVNAFIAGACFMALVVTIRDGDR